MGEFCCTGYVRAMKRRDPNSEGVPRCYESDDDGDETLREYDVFEVKVYPGRVDHQEQVKGADILAIW